MCILRSFASAHGEVHKRTSCASWAGPGLLKVSKQSFAIWIPWYVAREACLFLRIDNYVWSLGALMKCFHFWLPQATCCLCSMLVPIASSKSFWISSFSFAWILDFSSSAVISCVLNSWFDLPRLLQFISLFFHLFFNYVSFIFHLFANVPKSLSSITHGLSKITMMI